MFPGVSLNFIISYLMSQACHPGTSNLFKTDVEYGISIEYRIVESSNSSCLEAHAGFFRLLMKGIFDPYVL